MPEPSWLLLIVTNDHTQNTLCTHCQFSPRN
jgi:hypothetical protein